MTGELKFLIDFLLGHKLPIAAKLALAERIGLVEDEIEKRQQTKASPNPTWNGPVQAPSTAAAMARQVEQPEVVGQTQAAVQALASRQSAIATAMSGVPEKGLKSPRKF